MSTDPIITTCGTVLLTNGLRDAGHPELRVETYNDRLVDAGKEFLLFVSRYLRAQGRSIMPGETVGYGYWQTRFMLSADGKLDAWEYSADATQLIEGARLTLTYWVDQHEICNRYSAPFAPAKPHQLVAISAGVFDGDPVQGVRYPSPEHMSGWWITTDRYNGDIKTIKTEHLYHLTATRPDLARYIALPYGFRFDLSQREDVWYEETVARQPET